MVFSISWRGCLYICIKGRLTFVAARPLRHGAFVSVVFSPCIREIHGSLIGSMDDAESILISIPFTDCLRPKTTRVKVLAAYSP